MNPTSEVQAQPGTARRHQWHLRTPNELAQRSRELGGHEHIIEGLIPERSLTLMVGDSGLGKSPLAYQMAVCIATGTPFLGRPVRQGKVIYIDCENGVNGVDVTVKRLLQYLRVDASDNLLLLSTNDAPPAWGQANWTLESLVREFAPSMVIIDSLSSFKPGADEKNSSASTMYQQLRRMTGESGTSFVLIHHLKKPSSDHSKRPPSLDDEYADLGEWFEQARGARSLINGSDVRIGLDRPGTASLSYSLNGGSEEIALVMRGFTRLRGEIPRTYIARTFDDTGAPLGYRMLAGAELLPPDQRQAYERLPQTFRFKDAKFALKRSDQPTANFLDRLIAQGLARKAGRGYEKVATGSGGSDGVVR